MREICDCGLPTGTNGYCETCSDIMNAIVTLNHRKSKIITQHERSIHQLEIQENELFKSLKARRQCE